MSGLDRRDVVRSALSVGVAGLLGGCSVLGGDDRPERRPYDVPQRSSTPTVTRSPTPTEIENPGEVVDFGSVSIPDPGPAWYRKWLPTPGGYGTDQGYSFSHFDLQAVREAGDAVPAGFDEHRRRGRLGLDYFGVGFENYDRVLRFPYGSAVIEGEFAASTVAGTLSETGYREAGTDRGYRLFSRDDGARAAAVGDGELVWVDRLWWYDGGPPLTGRGDETGGPPDPPSVVESVLDAREGGDRMRSAGLSGVASVGGGPASGQYVPVSDGAGPFGLDGVTGVGYNTTFGDSPVVWVVLAFDRDVEADRVTESLRKSLAETEFGRSARAAEVTVLGTSATVAAVPPDGWQTNETGVDTYPQVTWGFDYDAEAGTLTVVHEAGDEIPTDRLDARGPVVLPAFPDGETVSPGDERTFDVTAGDGAGFDEGERSVEITFVGPDDTLERAIGRYVLPENSRRGTTDTTTG